VTFLLFPKIKPALEGTRFESIDTLKARATELLNKLSEVDVQHCFQQWKIHMQWCRDRLGEHIEDDTNCVMHVTFIFVFTFDRNFKIVILWNSGRDRLVTTANGSSIH
jgi:hypothetical protein